MKTIKELLEEQKMGTYIGVRFSGQTQKDIGKFLIENKIPNPINIEKLHTTIIHSKKNLPNLEPLGAIVPPEIGYFKGHEVWDTKDGNRALVMKFDCEALRLRNDAITSVYGATSDYDEYKIHLTLSYDIGDMDVWGIPSYKGKIEITEEYYEPLDLDWINAK